jgi:histidinol phosphatase-like PHP family hydrolase
MIANYHTHTMRCKHAFGTDEEYVLEAIKHGYKDVSIYRSFALAVSSF